MLAKNCDSGGENNVILQLLKSNSLDFDLQKVFSFLVYKLLLCVSLSAFGLCDVIYRLSIWSHFIRIMPDS